MKMKMLKTTLAAAVLIAAGSAKSITFTASQGDLAASATFTANGNFLTIVLANTSQADVMAPQDVLTALFFSVAGVPPVTLTPYSAMLTGGSHVFFGPENGGNVGGEWGYNLNGVSSTGLDGVWGAPNFNGPNLQDPAALDGVQYGITSANDNTASGNAAVTGSNALIKNSVTLVLSGLDQLPGFNVETAISNVKFQYGTSQSEPSIPGTVPDGGTTLVLLGMALSGISATARFFRRQVA